MEYNLSLVCEKRIIIFMNTRCIDSQNIKPFIKDGWTGLEEFHEDISMILTPFSISFFSTTIKML